MSEWIENKTFDEIQVGDGARVKHILTKRDIELFAVMSGDVNPSHVDEEYAKTNFFHKIVGHGMWGGSLISTVLGTELPGPGTIYLGQSFRFLKPVVIGDTVTAQVTVTSKQPEKKHVILDCVCRNQRGEDVIVGTAEVLAPTEKVKRKRMKLPNVQMCTKEHNAFYEQLIAKASTWPALRTAVVHPMDKGSLGGAIQAAKEGIIDPIFVANEANLQELAQAEGFDLSPYEIVSVQHSHAAAERAVELVHQGRAEALMKGKIHTQELMQPILKKVTGLRTGRRMSHVFLIDPPTYHKALLVTDAAINISPNLSQKKDIVQNAIDLFLALGMGTPNVAVVSAVETVDEAIPSTLDATALCKMAERGQITGGILDGPLALDNAISKEAAESKGIVSPVAGNADIIVVPDVEAGNMLYKQFRYLSGIESAGMVLGARVPIILTSRAAGAGLTRIASCALASLYLREQTVSV